MKDGKRRRLSVEELLAKERERDRLNQHKAQVSTYDARVNVLSTIAKAGATGAVYRGSTPMARKIASRAERRGWRPPEVVNYEQLRVISSRMTEVSRRPYASEQGTIVRSGTVVKYSVTDTSTLYLLEGEYPRRVFHGTSVSSLGSILQTGLQPSSTGLLGPGLYVGPMNKALDYLKRAGSNDENVKSLIGVLFELEVAMGRIVDQRDSKLPDFGDFDTVHGIPNLTATWTGTLRKEEWCIREPKNRVRIKGVSVYIETSVKQNLRRTG